MAAVVAVIAAGIAVALLRSPDQKPRSSAPQASGTAGAGEPSVRVDRVTRQGEAYLVFYSAQNFVPRLEAGNRHLHFFWNTVEPGNAGANGHPPKPYVVYAGPAPFRGFKVADRPAGATQICALVADETNSVEVGTGSCGAVPS